MSGLVPTLVKKAVNVRRREIYVHILGNDLLVASDASQMTVERMLNYWLGELERGAGYQPDLIVLPEICDVYIGNVNTQQRLDWLQRRGNVILDAFREYAKAHNAYLVYPSYRDLGDGKLANCSILIDRQGDVVGIYDKVYPTIGDIERNGVVPGKEPVVVETDFGTLGFVICFDLNFWDLQEAYAKLRPNVLAFSSYYHGSLMQQSWAYRCQSYLLAATVGRIEKNIVAPDGTIIDDEHSYYSRLINKINTNFALVHLDFNAAKIEAALKAYGRRITMHNNNGLGCVLLTSNDENLQISDVIKEYGIELWDDYYARSQAHYNLF